jgi:hypothetical protein
MSQMLIGLAGRARVGKDTVASYLAAHLTLISYAFADPLKQALAGLFSLTAAQLEGAEKELPLEWLGKSPRELMQLLGTEWGRDLVHPQLWLLLAERNLQAMAELNQDMQGVVIRDVRFDNEADWVRSKGGVIVHITRPDASVVADHVSESGVTVWPLDHVVVNDGPIEHLYDDLESLIRTLQRNSRQAA